MNTGTGRFYTMDTFVGHNEQPISLHKYLYVADNPPNETDPTGHIIEIDGGGPVGSSIVWSQIQRIRGANPALGQ
jgi:hypothetical protein